MQDKAKALDLLRIGVGNPDAIFRTDQWEAIEFLLKGKRLLLVEATGWGKSYVYFVVCKLLRQKRNGITVLVSPLLSLIRNQLSAANRMGIKAASINSSNPEEWNDIFHKLKNNDIDLLLVSPERLANEVFLEFFRFSVIKHLCFLIVDEAHCISDWGHDFRPDYQRLKRVINLIPLNIPVLATTATANNRVVQDIRRQLQKNFMVMRGHLMRKSIALQNISIPNPYKRMVWLAKAVKQLPGSGIVYVLTKRYCEIIAEWLIENGITARAYHSSIDKSGNISRAELEKLFMKNDIKVLVATVALGMGYDKPDISFVIHFHRPASVVHYYQQVGRAGRALKKAWGILLQGDEDADINNYFIEQAYPSLQYVEHVLSIIEKAVDGITKKQLMIKANLRDKHIEQVVKLLSVVSPSPVTYENGKFYRNGNRYHYPIEKVEALKELRQQEQQEMISYMNHTSCLMRFLSEKLDDPYMSEDCGKCSNCVGNSLFDIEINQESIIRAELFVKQKPLIIKPRKIFPKNELMKFYHDIPYYLESNNLLVQEGRILCRYHDPGLGKLVSHGKYVDGTFDHILVQESVNLIYNRWFPEQKLPFKWVTCIPSQKHENLVPDFAKRLAKSLNIKFSPAIISTGEKKHQQKAMNNNLLKLINLDGEYRIDKNLLLKDSVLLVDDMIESGWTLNLAGILLKKAGLKGEVFPFALAVTREL